MKKQLRKAFMSIEMLLIIGVVVGLLALAFTFYKSINKNTAAMQVSQDIASITNGLDRYKGATGAYPYGVGALINQSSTAVSSVWNSQNAYIAQDVASRWNYTAEIQAGSAWDVDTKTAIGFVYVSVLGDAYPALKASEVRDILRGKCLNGMVDVGNSALTQRITSATSNCVLSGSTVLYDPNR